MRILIAGGTGSLGRALTTALRHDGHHVVILTRRPPADGTTDRGQQPSSLSWSPDGSVGPWAVACGRIDAVVNLAGESIASGRWSQARKHTIRDSRVLATRSLARFVAEAVPRPSVFVSGSAIGYYGDRSDEPLDEQAAAGTDFLADVGLAWEAEAQTTAGPVTRVVLFRTGIVLDPAAGALARMLLPFRLCAGGPFGSGRQYMSWIHRDDWVALVTWCLKSPGIAGPVNAVAPNAVTNAEFARTLGRVLGRPAVIPAPAFLLRLILGEMAGPLLLGSQRVVPAAAERAGFTFAFPQLEGALRDLLGVRHRR